MTKSKYSNLFRSVPSKGAESPGTQHTAYARTQGKRENPEFRQVSAYVRKTTYSAVRMELLKDGEDGKPREFSDLVEDLLERWLKGRANR